MPAETTHPTSGMWHLFRRVRQRHDELAAEDRRRVVALAECLGQRSDRSLDAPLIQSLLQERYGNILVEVQHAVVCADDQFMETAGLQVDLLSGQGCANYDPRLRHSGSPTSRTERVAMAGRVLKLALVDAGDVRCDFRSCPLKEADLLQAVAKLADLSCCELRLREAATPAIEADHS